MNHEVRFHANMTKKRRLSYVAIFACLLLGYLYDVNGNHRFPSAVTVLSTLFVYISFQLHRYLKGVKALSISSNGISLERWFGQKMIRLSWNEIKGVEVRRPLTGPIWTFCTKAGDRIRWVQTGYEGDKRSELEQALMVALQQHGIRLV